MNKVVYILLSAFLALFAWVGWEFYKANQPKLPQFFGEIEAQTYGVSSKIPGRIDKIYVKKGQKVQKGDLIFTIISPELEAKLAQAQAAKAAAASKRQEADNGARKEQIEAAKSQYEKAKAAAKLLEKTYNRIEKLYKEGVISEQKKDEVYTKYQAALYTEKGAKELYEMAKKGARVELKQAAKAQEDVYIAKVQEVKAFLDETKVYAFHSGEVSQVMIHEGELSPSGFPVVMLTDLNDAWARITVREDYIKEFQKGKKFDLYLPAFGKKFPFVVKDISVMGEYAEWKAAQNDKGYDLKSFEVELRPLGPIPGLRAGMNVVLRF